MVCTRPGHRHTEATPCTAGAVHTWFHLAMRIHHAAQAAKGWLADTPGGCADGARLADAVERIRWRLWHGQVRRALDLIGETLAWSGGMAGAAPAAAKVTASLRGLETYVSGQAELIIDYAKARRGASRSRRRPRRARCGGCCTAGWAPTSRCAGRREARIGC